MHETQAYHVEWFITREALSDITIRIDERNQVSVESGRASDAIDFGAVALIDGLVNAHTHLEFSGMSEPISTTGRFTDWIRSVVEHRRNHPSSVPDSIRSGLRESIQAGTTLLGEIVTSGWTWRDYSESGLYGVIFQELLGLLPDRIAQQKELVRTRLSEAREFSSPNVSTMYDQYGDSTKPASPQEQNNSCHFVAGISPHAPYSTHLDLVADAVDLAITTGCPLAMHLAENRSELEFLSSGTGEFRELLSGFGIWRDDRSQFGQRPMDYLRLLAKAPRTLIIHGNFLDDDELQFLASQPQMTLVYCPRTHAAFGHSEHPWRRAKQLGVRTALGTDSRASNPDLSIFAELQFLAANNLDISHLELLQMGSINGRRALGFEKSTAANFTLIRLENTPLQNPDRQLFSPENRVCGTMIDGRWSWLSSELHHQCRNETIS